MTSNPQQELIHRQSSTTTQSAGNDPKLKRNSGLFSFLRWFRSTSRESIITSSSSNHTTNSLSGSSDSVNSSVSIGTVASFSYVPPIAYKNGLPAALDKCITPGPETDTYRARLKQRDKRREKDQNVTLRRKYKLFFSRDTSNRKSGVVEVEENNCKSLPLMTRKMEQEQKAAKDGHHRRTNSDSSKQKKSGAYLHVKGKRKAPQPPPASQSLLVPPGSNTTLSLRRNKKRAAPAPPSGASNGANQDELVYADAIEEDILCNDSLKLDHGILKPAKDSFSTSNLTLNARSANNSPTTSARNSYILVEAPVSPRPWYKRNSSIASSKKEKVVLENKTNLVDNNYEPIERYSGDDKASKKKEDNKRKSALTYLPNISQLDREAAEILSKNKSTSDMPEFMRPKEVDEENVPTITPKRKSARDLIAKFNAITNVTKVTVNSTFFGGGGGSSKESQKENNTRRRDYFGRAVSLSEEVHEKQNNKKTSSAENCKNNGTADVTNAATNSRKSSYNFNPLMKSESAAACVVKCKSEPKEQLMKAPPQQQQQKTTTSTPERKPWFCPKCNLENDYWRIICYVCSTIKPYFDELPTSNRHHGKVKNSDGEEIKVVTSSSVVEAANNRPAFNALERSKTQIGFSALVGYNKSKTPPDAGATSSGSSTTNNPTAEINNKKDEREKLKKMLIEMKNSLPKRRSSGPNLKRKSTIDENPELTITVKPEEESSKAVSNSAAEVVIVTQQIVYENIKVKKTDLAEIEKPLKVSSSAQTSGVIRKPISAELGAKVNQIIPKVEPKNGKNFELLRPKDFADIYSDRVTKSVTGHVYANTANTFGALTEKAPPVADLFVNMPRRFSDLKADIGSPVNNADTLEINRLLRRLETAIAKGELTQASIYARDLAQLKVNCSVVRQKSLNGDETVIKKDTNTFTIDMFVEDRLSHRGPFPLHVETTFTVLDLKKLVEKDFEIPVNVQRWILGKELAVEDHITLNDHNITEGCPVFLYLVAPNGNNDPTNKPGPVISAQNGPSTSAAITQVEKQKTVTEIQKEVSKDTSNKPTIIDVKLKDVKITTITDNVNVTENVVKVDKPNEKQNVVKVDKPNEKQNVVVTNTVVTVEKNSVKQAPIKVEDKLVVASNNADKGPPKIEKVQVVETNKNATEWSCKICTLLNPNTMNICGVCANIRQVDLPAQPTTKNAVAIAGGSEKKVPKATAPAAPQQQVRPPRHYQELMHLDSTDVVTNTEPFECLVCLVEIPALAGVTLRDCLHQFCRACLANTVQYSDEAEVKCPFRDDQYACDMVLQAREIKALVTRHVYEQFLARSMSQAENRSGKSFHCKTPDCRGWCIFEDNVNEFRCPVCRIVNCLTCQAIHTGLNCKQHQQLAAASDATDDDDDGGRRTRAMLDEMVARGDALTCPACQVVLMKKWGCDWVRCSMCKTEICWVTRGARWGPAGKGDTSAGCKCGVNGVKCHPQCNYCH